MTWFDHTSASFISVNQSRIEGTTRKTSNVSALMTTDDIGDYSLEVVGGIGLKVPGVLIFEGSETQVSRLNTDAIHTVVISWDDSAVTDSNAHFSDTNSGMFTFATPRRDGDYYNPTNFHTNGIGRFYSPNGKVVCDMYFWENNLIGRLDLVTTNNDDDISNVAIRRVWRKIS